MTKEDIRVNIIYLWRKYGETLEYVLIILTSPVWFPIVLLLLILCPPVTGEEEEQDIKWCEEHGKKYPSEESLEDAHSIVKWWKKEYEKEQKKKTKEKIRMELRKNSLSHINIRKC